MTKKTSIDALLEQFDHDETEIKGRKKIPITLWVTEDSKRKYDAIQAKNRRFSRVLREIVEASIERKYQPEVG